MSNNQQLQQLLDALPPAEPPAALGDRIMGGIEKLLALENYHKAAQLLSTQHTRLDTETTSNLLTAMSAIEKQYGNGFQEAYSVFVAQQNAMQAHAKPDEPEHGRG